MAALIASALFLRNLVLQEVCPPPLHNMMVELLSIARIRFQSICGIISITKVETAFSAMFASIAAYNSASVELEESRDCLTDFHMIGKPAMDTTNAPNEISPYEASEKLTM